MRTSILLWFACLIALLGSAQSSRLTVGAFCGTNVTTKMSAFGWNAGMVGLFNLNQGWIAQVQVGGLVERNRERYSLFDLGKSREVSIDNPRSWIESSVLVGYRYRVGDNV